jgi:hypothetical protein
MLMLDGFFTCSIARVLSLLITTINIRINNFIILEILNLYNGGFIVHNILLTFSRYGFTSLHRNFPYNG